jgi:hypothetical protein
MVPKRWSARVNQQQRGDAVGASVVAPVNLVKEVT